MSCVLVTTALGTTVCPQVGWRAADSRWDTGGAWHHCRTPPAGDVEDSTWLPGVMKMGVKTSLLVTGGKG